MPPCARRCEGRTRAWREMQLVDYKVRVVNSREGTAARVRVVIETRDADDVWGTVGVSENIIEASWLALVDSFEYKLFKDEEKLGSHLARQRCRANGIFDSCPSNFPNNTIRRKPSKHGLASGTSTAISTPSPISREPFTIVIPPPNVTGALHMGHALNNTLQDVLIRWRRMQGYNALYMPGTDHAGIATQAVVERLILQQEKKTRHDLGREALVQRIWEWKDRYEARILGQLASWAAAAIGSGPASPLIRSAPAPCEQPSSRCFAMA